MSYAEEIRRQRQQMLAMGIQPEGMISQSAVAPMEQYEAAAADLSGQERRLDRMQQYAAQLRNRQTPQGRTVGPSGIYVAPTWSENLAGAASKLAGGYLGGRALQQDRELDPQRAAKTTAGAGLARARDLRAQDQWQAGHDQTNNLAQLKIDADAALQGQTIAAGRVDDAAAHRRALELANLAEKGKGARDVETVSYFNPNAGQEGQSPVLTYRLSGGQVVDNANRPVDVTGLTPYEATGPTALSAKETTARQDIDDKIFNMTEGSSTVDLLRDPQLEAATGAGDYRQWLGRWGYGADGAATQTTQRKINQMAVNGTAGYLERMKLTPVSDTDIKLVQSPGVNKFTQPRGFADYAMNNELPVVVRAFDAGIRNGTHTPEQKQAEIDKLGSAIVFRGLRTGIPYPEIEKQLLQYGVSPEQIEIEKLKYEIEQEER